MGRGGGGSGGGRSFSSGGGRSFGGRSSSSSRGGGSSSRFRGSSSSYRPTPSFRAPVHHYHHYGSSYRYHGGSGGGLIGLFIVLVAAACIIAVAAGIMASGSGVSKSTIEREAIKPGAPFIRECIDDRAEWIGDRNTLLRGMESFYKATGVQPAISITTEINGDSSPAIDEIEAFAESEYDKLIGHEKGVLLLFCEWSPNNWDAYYMAGEAAQTVMDSEACDILLDYVETYYTSDLSEDEYFAKVFSDTGERIMTVTPTVASYTPMIVGGIVLTVIAICVVIGLKAKHKRDKELAEETERILHTPMDRL